MTPRGRAVLALGLVVYVVAWVFGARALYPVAAGLVLAVAVAVAWVRLSSVPPFFDRHGASRDVVEGEDVRIDLIVQPVSPLSPPTLVAHESVGRLGERDLELVRVGHRRYAGGYELRGVARGRYLFETARLSVEDPFGLARARIEQPEAEALVVYPRLVDLGRLFSEGGGHAQEGRRLLLRRASGYELHSVRDYAQGESLRRVHWPSTARRGRLMVKELEDAPRDEVTVLLDGDAVAVAGEPPESSFDVAVRAAGSLLLAHVQRGRRCVLVLNSARRETQAVASEGGDWRRALEVLAAAEPTARTPVSALLDAEEAPPRAPSRSSSSRRGSSCASRTVWRSGRSPAAARRSSTSSPRASPTGRGVPSPRCCASRRSESPSRSCAGATISPPRSRRPVRGGRPRLGHCSSRSCRRA